MTVSSHPQILSLGSDCQTKYNLSRYMFKCAFGHDNNFTERNLASIPNFQGNFFFDWSITRCTALLKVFDLDFKRLLERENLVIEPGPDNSVYVKDKRTKQIYPHLFPGSEDGTLNEYSLDMCYNDIKSKIDYLVVKTKSFLCSQEDKLLIFSGAATGNQLNTLVNSVSEYSPNFRLLFVPWKNLFCEQLIINDELDSRIMVRSINRLPYPGDLAEWDKALEAFICHYKNTA